MKIRKKVTPGVRQKTPGGQVGPDLRAIYFQIDLLRRSARAKHLLECINQLLSIA